jgi:hypothetical protein
MRCLAIINFAELKDTYGSELISGFELITPAVYSQASQTPGFVAKALPCDQATEKSFFERDWGPWGRFEVPGYYSGGREVGTDLRASALSLWKDIGSLYRFVYAGVHLRAMKRKDTWMVPPRWPTYAMWWTDVTPTWSDGSRRLEYLEKNGESSRAFTFRSPFDSSNSPVKLSDVL